MDPNQATASRVWTTLDFEEDGKSSDYLRVPHSTDRSAYGWIPVPITSVRNGAGPTALLVGGNHGDEYEGQIVLAELARQIQPAEITGSLIIIPALNQPAARAGRRNSPLDGGNLNRAFPGDAHGTPTQMIAHFVDSVILPRSDLVIDMHSGGQSLEFVPCGLMRRGTPKDMDTVMRRALRDFGAPISYVTSGTGGGGATTLAAAAEQRHIPAIMTELGGGGAISSPALALARAGLRRVLIGFGILAAETGAPPQPTRFMEVRDRSYYVYADESGVFEPAVSLGDTVKAGQLAGRIHFPTAPCRAPAEAYFQTGGFVGCRRVPADVEPGDCLFHLLSDLP